MLVGFAIPRATVMDATWTTVHLVAAALRLGHPVRLIEPWDFEIEPRGRLVARSYAFEPGQRLEAAEIADRLVHRTAPRRFVDVARLGILLLRNSPLRSENLAFAMMAQQRGVPVVNDPAGVLAVCHKSWLAGQEGVKTPETLVTRSRAAVHLFADRQALGVVVKPARSSGGRAVSLVPADSAASLDQAFDTATSEGDGYVVVQPYVATAEEGEKRLIWVDGEVLGGYLRRRAEGEFRHNLKQGAIAEPTEVGERERAVVRSVSRALLRAGVRFAGLDVIGDYLIEVNALNPGGTYHTDRLSGSKLGEAVIRRLTSERPGEGSWASPAT